MQYCSIMLFIPIAEREETIVSTNESSIYSGWSASNLLDGKGLDGTGMQDYQCYHSEHTNDLQWVSLELAVPGKVSRVQMVPRLDCCADRASNIRITIGPSASYDPSEPLCLPEIPQLLMEAGLTNYNCTGPLHEGRYVKISREGTLNLCEVKVFTLPGKSS